MNWLSVRGRSFGWFLAALAVCVAAGAGSPLLRADGAWTWAAPRDALALFADGFEPLLPCSTAQTRDQDGDGLFDPGCVTETSSPDPTTTATPLDPTVPADFGNAIEFLYESPTPVQHAMRPGVIEKHRVSVLRGEVRDETGEPLPGVLVRVLDHPEVGYTYTRDDGVFDIAVNGGGEVVLDYHKPGYLRAQRQAVAPWRDWEWVPDATLVPLDTVATQVVLGPQAPRQIVRSSVIDDEDGTREAVLLLPSTLNAALEAHDGTLTPMTQLTVRATEYTVGERGPSRMPAALPPNVAYTYAVEFSADEAIAANARSVVFDQPLGFYLDNFLEFPVGTVIPVGAYDARLASWLPSDNGRVVKILSIEEGMAMLDVDGSGVAADVKTLAALGIGNGERQQLATLYSAGKELWRTPVSHFTPWDCNFPYAPNPDDQPPPDQGDDDPDDEDIESDEPRDEDVDEDNEEECGSLIRCEEGSLAETIPLAGTGMSLVYSSKRVARPDQDRKLLRIRVTSSTVPDRLEKATLELVSLGVHHVVAYDAPVPDVVLEQALNSVDAYGRRWTGAQPWKATLGYQYPLVYMGTDRDGFERAWAQFAASGNQAVARYREAFYTITKTWDARTRNVNGKVVPAEWDATGLGFGAWSLSNHHVLDKDRWIIYLGDGTEQRINLPGQQGLSVSQALIRQYGPDDLRGVTAFGFDPGGAVLALAHAPGSPYPGSSALWRHSFQGGSQMLVDLCGAYALTCIDTWGYAGPDLPKAITVDSRGHAYVVAGRYIFEVTPQGQVSKQFDGALHSSFCEPNDIAAWSDRVFFTCGSRVLALWRDGQVTHLAGGGAQTGQDVPPADFDLGQPTSIAVNPDGTIYIVDALHSLLYRIRTNGVVEVMAGNGTAGTPQEGGIAIQQPLDQVVALAMTKDGNPLLYSHYPSYRLRELKKDGRIFTLAGGGNSSIGQLDQGQSLSLDLHLNAADIAVLPDGGVAFVPNYNGSGTNPPRSTIGLIASSFSPAFDGYGALDTGGYRLVSRTGAVEYRFDQAGHHLTTHATTTGALVVAFEYDAEGYVIAAVDGDGNRTTFTRNTAHQVTEITAPDGQRTTLAFGEAGLLGSVADPIDRTWQMDYVPSTGLLASFAKPRGHASTFTWASGRLASDTHAEGGGWGIDRIEWTDKDAHEVTLTSAQGRINQYSVDDSATKARKRQVRRATGTGHDLVANNSALITTARTDGVQIVKQLQSDPRFGWNAPYTKQVTTTIPGAGSGGGNLTHTVVRNRQVTVAGGNNPGTGRYDLDFTTSINGRTYRQTYDATNHLWQLTTPRNRTQTVKLDERGRPIERNVPGLAPVHYAYDTRGRLESVTSGSGEEERRIQIAYDANGWPYQIVDAEQRYLLLEHDVIGRLETQTLPDGREIGFRYDANSNLVGLTPPEREEHGFAYDKIDRLTTYTAPEAQIGEASATSYGYNLDSQLTQVTRPDARTVALGYHATTGVLGTIQSTTQGARPVTMDGYGRWTEIGNIGAYRLGASWNGPLMRYHSVNVPITSSWSYRYVYYGYDANLRITSVDAGVVPSSPNQPATYQYDTDSLLTQLAFGGRTVAYSRNAGNGLLEGATVGSLSETWGYNDFAEPIQYGAKWAGSTKLAFAYARDKLGRITEVVETNQGSSRTTAYGYDLAGRLGTVTRNGEPIAEYGYDANSNRIETIYTGSLAAALTACAPQNGPITADVDAQDRMTRYGTCIYSYGANGELQQKTDTAANETTDYEYDEFGNLREVQLPDGRQITYGIDGLNRRVAKFIDGQLQASWLYKDQLEPIAELDASGNFVSVFAYGEKPHVPSLMSKGGITYKIVSDHLGSVRQVINLANGQIVQELDYDAWGNVLLDTNPGFQPFGYAGGLYDNDTGLVRFGARDYEPIMGRWTAKDPIGFDAGSSNLHSYIDGDPINNVDSDGLQRAPMNPWNIYQRQYKGSGETRTQVGDRYRQTQLDRLTDLRQNDFHEALSQLPDASTLQCKEFTGCWVDVLACTCPRQLTCPVGPEVGPPPDENPKCDCNMQTVPVW